MRKNGRRSQLQLQLSATWFVLISAKRAGTYVVINNELNVARKESVWRDKGRSLVDGPPHPSLWPAAPVNVREHNRYRQFPRHNSSDRLTTAQMLLNSSSPCFIAQLPGPLWPLRH